MKLSDYLFEKLRKHQSDSFIQRTRPMLSRVGFLFNNKDLEKWIQEYEEEKKSNTCDSSDTDEKSIQR
mgnify:FL=1|jgi:hypothetical protein